MQNEYRTFEYELLAGDPSLAVEVKSLDCIFRFDYSKVYWNPRLGTEHERIVKLLRPGDAICDVMAGVGPFAIPAGKRRVFAFANDLNPSSHSAMLDAINLNKVCTAWIFFLPDSGRRADQVSGFHFCKAFQPGWSSFHQKFSLGITQRFRKC